MRKRPLIRQDPAHVGGDLPSGPVLAPCWYGDGGVLVILFVELVQLRLDGFLLLRADVSFACGLISRCPSFSSFERLLLRPDIWNVGPSVGSAVCGGDRELFDERHG